MTTTTNIPASVYRIPQANRANYKPGQIITGTDKNRYYVTQGWALRNKANRKLWTGKNMPDYVTPATTPTTTTPATTPANPMLAEQQAQATAAMTDTLFPNIRAFEPKNYEGSPLYQFQKEQGMKEMEKLMASHGLTNSTYQHDKAGEFLTQLGAQEAQRAQDVAEKEADRLQTIQQNEMLRRERSGNENYRRLEHLIDLLVAQNPYASGANAAGQMSSQTSQAAQSILNALTQAATMVTPASGGGGGGSAPIYPTSNNMELSANQNWTNDWTNILASIFSQWK